MRRYKHRQSGAIFETDRDMPLRDWEPLECAVPQKEEPAAPPKRKRTRKKTAPEE